MSRSYLRWIRRGAIVGAAVLMVGFAVGSLAGSKRDADTGAGAVRQARSGTGTTEAVAVPAPGAAGGVVTGRGPAVTTDSAGPLGTLQLPASPGNVIKTADIAIEVGKRRLGDAFNRVTALAGKYGGFVLSSSRGGPQPIPLVEGDVRVAPGVPQRAEDGDDLADLVLRIPADRFDQAVAELAGGAFGKVTRQGSSGQDVSQEFVDLESRLRHLRAQEAVLLRLMAKATSIADTIAVQQQLSQVQLQIEEITGRLRYLKSQTQFATISVHLAEPGATLAVGPDEGPSLEKAWDTAIEGLQRMGAVALIGGIWLSPFILLAIVVLAGRRFRRPAAQA